MKNILDVENLDGVRVLVRADFNVPIQNGIINDDFRIRKSLPLLKYLIGKGAQLILISHIETKDDPTLKPVADALKKMGIDCVFENNYKKALSTKNKVTLLENLRGHDGEKNNDRKFARELASLADIYVNEAFSCSHREHASICAITEFIPSYAGLQFAEEIKHLSSAFNPDHPFLFILGGAKFDTKLPLVEKFIKLADTVFIGGALANDFFKEQGRDIGTSMVSDTKPDLSNFLHSEKLLLPLDSILKDTAIMDAGLKTVEMLRQEIEKARYVLWNGPLGAYETGYKASTLQLAEILADATKKGAKTIVGGGDTLATITELKLEDSFTFVSTGGGAMLEYLAKGTLPGIKALT
ncbi:MAG: phosphoglycerate kinase [Patescibacteria group bacterium]